jgi:hypothetical protein
MAGSSLTFLPSLARMTYTLPDSGNQRRGTDNHFCFHPFATDTLVTDRIGIQTIGKMR